MFVKATYEPQYWVDSCYLDFALAVAHDDPDNVENFDDNLRWAIQDKAERKTLLHLFHLRHVLRKMYNA